MKCNVKSCDHTATVQVGFKTWATGFPSEDRFQTTMLMGLFVCDDCQKTTKLEQVVTDEGWDVVLAGFVKLRRQPPDRARLELMFSPIPKPPGGLN